MAVRDWALIAFTILAQMSIGAFLVLGVVHFFAMRKAGMEEADRLSDRALLAIGPLMVLSLLASLFHLGNPLNAYRAVTNLGSSWLSREVFFSVLFTIAGGVFALYVQFGVQAGHLMVASVMAVPAGLICAKMLVPETETPATLGHVGKIESEPYGNVVEAAADSVTVRWTIEPGYYLYRERMSYATATPGVVLQYTR